MFFFFVFFSFMFSSFFYFFVPFLLESKGWLQLDRFYSLHNLWTGDVGKLCFVLFCVIFLFFFRKKKKINTFIVC